MQEKLEFGAGAILVMLALSDIFATLLVPGPVTGRFSAVIAVRKLSLPIWRRAARRRDDGDRRPSNFYAPFTFIVTFLFWVLMLLFGYGLTMHAVGHLFAPRVTDLSDGVWIAGSSLVTLGVSEYDASGLARWLILAAGLSGFGAVTTAITFILQIQSGLHQREPAVLTLASMAGTPPSGIAILETMEQLHARHHLAEFFIEWRDWAAAVQHSHLAYPVLNYFRSVDTENDWLAALEAVLDAASLLVACTAEEEARGAATLLHRTGSRCAEKLAAAFRIEPERSRVHGREVDALLERLARAGYQARDGDAGARFVEMRLAYAGHVKALAHHMGGNRAPVLPEEGEDSD